MFNRLIRDKLISRSKNTLETVVNLVCIFYICLQGRSRMKGYPHGKDVRCSYIITPLQGRLLDVRAS